MLGIHPTRHDTNMVCVWRHNPYVADMIFCVTDTFDDMSLCRVDWAPQKNDTTPTFPAKRQSSFSKAIFREKGGEPPNSIFRPAAMTRPTLLSLMPHTQSVRSEEKSAE